MKFKQRTIVNLLSASALTEPDSIGAVQNVTINLSEKLAQSSQVYIISNQQKNEELCTVVNKVHYLKVKKLDKLTLFWFRLVLKPFYYGYLLTAAHIINGINPDILIVHNRPDYICFLRKRIRKNIKIVLHEHNHNLADTYQIKKAEKILDCVDAVIAVSQFSKNYDIVNLFPKSAAKAHVVFNAVNMPEIIDEISKHKAKKEMGLINKTVILFAGAIRERKGIHLVLDAFEKLVLQYPETCLVVAGGSSEGKAPQDGYALSIIKRLEVLKDKAKYLGFVPHNKMKEIYSCADIFCAPSTWQEPFGLVFAEAMSYSIPVVTSHNGGIPELVIDSETGFTIPQPQENVGFIYEKLELLIIDRELRDKMGKEGRLRIKKHFTWDKSAQQLKRILGDN